MASTSCTVDGPAAEADATVYMFRKNAREQVRATLSTYHGHRIADLRVYVDDELGAAVPTRKGIAVRVEELPALRDAVEALLKAAA